MKPSPSPSTDQTPYEKFVDFTRRILAVPKAEMDRRRKRARKRKKTK